MLEVDYNGIIREDLTLDEFISEVPRSDIIPLFDEVLSKSPKKVVYTSFNGDFLDYINHMVYIALKLNYTPINPECALGYHLSSTAHNNKKVETMLDCISLELLSDELWLFLEDPMDADMYPEGVAAEIMAWLDKKSDTNMNLRIFGNEIVKAFNTIATIRDNATPIYNFCTEAPRFNEVNISDVANHFAETFSKEIYDKLIIDLERRRRECIYISTSFYDIKYSDWIRKYLYEQNQVGIVPSQLLNSFVLNFAYQNEVIKGYLADRYALLKKINKIYFVQKPINPGKFSIDFLFDVYFWLKNSGEYKASFYDWSRFGVPKFSGRWALTSKEHREVWR